MAVDSTEGEDQNNTEGDHLTVSSSEEGEGELPTDVVIRTTAVPPDTGGQPPHRADLAPGTMQSSGRISAPSHRS